jgi:GT2 family glycosyltransferase
VTPKKSAVGAPSVVRVSGSPLAPEISVVIPTYERAERLPALLEDLAKQTLSSERFEVVVVDDCSSTDTVDLVQRMAVTLPYHVRALRTPDNAGPAAARNLGWKLADGPLLAFLDDDCSPNPSWLEAGLAALLAHPEVGVLQGRTVAPDGVDLLAQPEWSLWRVIEEPTPFFEGCNLFFRRSVLEATGGFDEELGRYGEDTGAGWRALEAGWERGFAADALVVHEVEHRGWGWHVRNGLDERNIVQAAAKYPGYRREAFWRPWAVRREDAAFVLAAVGAVVGTRYRLALLLMVPYVLFRRPALDNPHFLRLCLEIPVVDAARTLGHVQGAVQNRVFVI